MKKIVCVFLITLTVMMNQVSVKAAKPEIISEAAILIDAKTGQVIYQKNQDEVLYPASITKILTIYLGASKIENPEKKVKVSKSAVDSVPMDTSNIALDYDEEISVTDCLYAAMLMSANDASNVIAEAVSGSIPKFVELMNATAKKFGARNTNFQNANGLPDKNHYTTAYDFAMITKNALKNENFKKIFCTVEHSIDTTNKKNEARNFVAQHRMVHWTQYQKLGVKGGKTGYTSNSLYTLVTYGQKEDKEFICVILKSPSFNDVYSDTEKLLNFGYTNFHYDSVNAEDIPEYVDGLTTYTAHGELKFLLNNDTSKEEIIKSYSGDTVQVSTADGTVLGELKTTSVTRKSTKQIVFLIIKIIVFLLLGAFIILYIIMIISTYKSKRRRRRNRKNLQ